jgi:hypothetical protein
MSAADAGERGKSASCRPRKRRLVTRSVERRLDGCAVRARRADHGTQSAATFHGHIRARTARPDTSASGVAFRVFSHRWNQRLGLLQAGRRIALRHDDLVAIGGGRRDQRRGQVATARAGSRPGYDVIHTGRGLHGSQRGCTTCRGKHHRRCGGYKIKLPHTTNVATCTSRASVSTHDATQHFRPLTSDGSLGFSLALAARLLTADQPNASVADASWIALNRPWREQITIATERQFESTRRGRAPACHQVEAAARRQGRSTEEIIELESSRA